jgi:hypothetical protein
VFLKAVLAYQQVLAVLRMKEILLEQSDVMLGQSYLQFSSLYKKVLYAKRFFLRGGHWQSKILATTDIDNQQLMPDNRRPPTDKNKERKR